MKRRATAILEDQQQPDTAYVMDANDQGLRAHFHRVRVLGGAVAVAAVIATIMIVLRGDGVTIESFLENEKSEDDIKKLVDDYNSISGSIGSFVSKPVEIFLGLLVSAAFLCFATDFTLDKGSIGHWQYVPLLTAAAIAYLFSNGLNALNVQVVSGKINSRISSTDLTAEVLVDDQPMFINGSLPMPWEHKYLENAANNSMLNTIMHSKIVPIQSVSSPCNGTGDRDVTEPFSAMSVVAFGFPSRPWHIELFMEAATPVKSLKIAMNTSTSNLPSDSALPSAVNVTRGLVNIGVRVLNDLYLSTNQTDPPTVPTTGAFVSAAHSTWLTMFNNTKGAYVKDATVEYSRFQLADKVTYDAVTFEVPVAMIQRDKFGLVVNQVNGFNEMVVEDYCSREGCLIPPAENSIHNKTTTVQSRVQVTSICVNDDGTENTTMTLPPCLQTSQTSFRVVSIGSRIEGDVWDMINKTGGNVMRFKNLRTVYSITIGRIAWETEDLAKVFAAECDNDEDYGGCEGLRYKLHPTVLDSQSDYLIVGKNSLPIKPLDEYTITGYDKWVYLVTGADGLGEQRYEVLRPRNFANVTESGASLRTIEADKCNTFTDDYIRAVERNHLYMEHSLQASYTSAFFYLFQNAVKVRRELPGVSKTSGNGKKSTMTTTSFGKESILTFFGNEQVMNVQVSVPTTNAIVSLVGCVVVLVVGVGVVMLAKKSEQDLRARANAEVVMEAMMNSSKYPPWLLDMALEQAAATYAHHALEQHQLQQQMGVDQLPLQEERARFVLQDLRVQCVNLQHREDTKHAFFVGSDQYRA